MTTENNQISLLKLEQIFFFSRERWVLSSSNQITLSCYKSDQTTWMWWTHPAGLNAAQSVIPIPIRVIWRIIVHILLPLSKCCLWALYQMDAQDKWNGFRKCSVWFAKLGKRSEASPGLTAKMMKNATAAMRAWKAAAAGWGVGRDVWKLAISCTVIAFGLEYVFAMFLEWLLKESRWC